MIIECEVNAVIELDQFIFIFKLRVDLEFLWMMLKRFGVAPPPLSFVLNFKVNELEGSLPLPKVIRIG